MIANCHNSVTAADCFPGDKFPGLSMTNDQIAHRFDEVAKLLEEQDANPFRVRAYRLAAETLRKLERSVAEMYQTEGLAAVRQLPAFGESLARSVQQLVRTGRLPLLDRLHGDSAPEKIFMTVAGIGPELATRIHHELGIETLAALEAAAYDGRLARLAGMGVKRLRGVRESLAGRFRNRPGREGLTPSDDRLTAQKNRLSAWARIREAENTSSSNQRVVSAHAHSTAMLILDRWVDVAELLSVDHEYRTKAAAGRLFQVRPRRFNPTGAAWLPILHTRRGERHYMALYSNTARAHDMGTTHDWVVIYRDDHTAHGQWTVVTAQFGRLKGRRIVRGREHECVEHYHLLNSTKESPTTSGQTCP